MVPGLFRLLLTSSGVTTTRSRGMRIPKRAMSIFVAIFLREPLTGMMMSRSASLEACALFLARDPKRTILTGLKRETIRPTTSCIFLSGFLTTNTFSASAA